MPVIVIVVVGRVEDGWCVVGRVEMVGDVAGGGSGESGGGAIRCCRAVVVIKKT
jgi:hypothetical protein